MQSNQASDGRGGKKLAGWQNGISQTREHTIVQLSKNFEAQHLALQIGRHNDGNKIADRKATTSRRQHSLEDTVTHACKLPEVC